MTNIEVMEFHYSQVC